MSAYKTALAKAVHDGVASGELDDHGRGPPVEFAYEPMSHLAAMTQSTRPSAGWPSDVRRFPDRRVKVGGAEVPFAERNSAAGLRTREELKAERLGASCHQNRLCAEALRSG